MNKYMERIYNGVAKENPTFVLMLGMCPTLAVTTSAINGLGMGVSTMVVLIFSNFIISLLRNIIPDKVRIPAYIVIVASLVTVVQLLMEAYVTTLYDALGIYIPLIVVNCIILGRAEAFASKNPLQIQDQYVRQGRIDLDGYLLYKATQGGTDVLNAMFSPQEVFDRRRPVPVVANGEG